MTPRTFVALSLVFILGAIAGTALAQNRTDVWNEASAKVSEIRIRSLPDGGGELQGTCEVTTTDWNEATGAGNRAVVTSEFYAARTPAQRTALGNVAGYALQACKRDFRLGDGGVP